MFIVWRRIWYSWLSSGKRSTKSQISIVLWWRRAEWWCEWCAEEGEHLVYVCTRTVISKKVVSESIPPTWQILPIMLHNTLAASLDFTFEIIRSVLGKGVMRVSYLLSLSLRWAMDLASQTRNLSLLLQPTCDAGIITNSIGTNTTGARRFELHDVCWTLERFDM